MTNKSPYSHLDPDDQEQVSLLLADVDTVLASETPGSLEKMIADASPRLGVALLSQVLPSFIKAHRTRHGVTPTLHELRLAHPDLAEKLSQSYPWIPASEQLPIEIRGYRILSVIGEGGQSVVLRAQDDVHSAVAIKVSTSVDHNELVLRERKLLGECDHPGIIQVINSGSHEGRAYFVMPHLRGAALVDRYSVRKPTPAEAVQIMAAICSALTHLHSRGIVHRDIKPANIWLDESGEVKLIDLGMAVQRTSWSRPLPAIAEFNGTPAFMSPEQASSDGAKDSELSDVFSAGATLYWLLTSTAPFAASNPKESISLAATGNFDKEILLSSLKYPQSLKRLCLKAMSIEPGVRFASAAECGEQLSRISHQTKRSGKPAKAIALISLITAVIGIPLSGNYSDWITGSSLTPQELRSSEERISHKLISNVQEPRWIDRVAAAQGIELAAIQSNDFQVSLACSQRDFQPWGSQKPTPEVKGKLLIRLDGKLLSLAKALEYRLGDRAWKTMMPSEEDETYMAILGQEATSFHGPVEIRFASDVSIDAENGAGPFRFDIDVANVLASDKASFVQELVEEVANAQCFKDSQSGWDMTDNFSQRYNPIIKDLRFATNPNAEMTSVLRHLEKLISDSREKYPLPLRYDLRQVFTLASQDIQSSPKLWIKIDFTNGSTYGPKRYIKQPSQSHKIKQANEWLAREGKHTGMAKLNHSRFELTGFTTILPVLESLQLVGEYVDADLAGFSNSLTSNGLFELQDAPNFRQLPNPREVEGKVINGLKSGISTITIQHDKPYKDIEVPPNWSTIFLRGRYKDGSSTTAYRYKNKNESCGWGVQAGVTSPGCPPMDTFIAPTYDEASDPAKSILRFLSQRSLSDDQLEKCKRTRLRLYSLLPAGAVTTEYYSDIAFTHPVMTAIPGTLYARYVDSQGEMIGYCSYRLSETFVRQMADHAFEHVSSQEKKHKSIRRLIHYVPKEQAPK